MAINESDFVRTFASRDIRKALIRSLIPHTYDPLRIDSERSVFLKSLVSDINSGAYFPSLPRGYTTFNRMNGVPRFVPAMSIRDICVYYFCISQLEKRIAGDRVKGTFGGWSMGNALRSFEDAEAETLPNSTDDEGVPYAIQNSINPVKWSKEWKQFQRIAFQTSISGEYCTFVKFDIANFYDSINLDKLERRIRSVISANESSIVDLLFILLRFWNRKIEGYSPKSVGLVQEELRDCSRLLANFYLQEYDRIMRDHCDLSDERSKYLRYADDQIIMTGSLGEAQRLLYQAGKELHRIGANINAGKVIVFESREDFNYYWAFEIFQMLDNAADLEKFNEAAMLFLKEVHLTRSSPNPRPWRADSVLRRIVNVGINKLNLDNRIAILSLILERRFLVVCESRLLEKICSSLDDSERLRFFELLEKYVVLEQHDFYHRQVRDFYSVRCSPVREIVHIDQRIEEIMFA